MATNQCLEVQPDAARVMEGLRDTGYQFHTAVADIVDNSIAANATSIDLKIDMDFRGRLRVAIADNGHGMDQQGLVNAMRYGSDRRPSQKSLGKFGLGMKTASTAFCKILRVTSRSSRDADLLRATWDLGHIAEVNRWELQFDAPDPETLAHFNDIATEGTGTVVVWENVDRLLKDYKDSGGTHAAKALKKNIDLLKEHLGMVFQRFLDENDARERNVKISVNGDPVFAWDPFCSGLSEKVATLVVPVSTPAGDAEFSLKAYVLPRKDEFPSEEEYKNAKINNDRQGIYIYRENRLIHDADWLGMYLKEPHYSLLRVDLSFDHKLDEALHIDIKKSQILLDEAILNVIKERFLPAPRREASNRARMIENQNVLKKAKATHAGSNSNIGAKQSEIKKPDLKVVNQATGECQVINDNGTFKIKLAIDTAKRPGEFYVQPVTDLQDGVLFVPALIDGHNAVQINTSHPYYKKVYIPNSKSGTAISGMDSLLWALCNAELSAWSDATKDYFEELRYELSKSLRKLVEDLPDPEVVDEAA